jgi:hypothetical protein
MLDHIGFRVAQFERLIRLAARRVASRRPFTLRSREITALLSM